MQDYKTILKMIETVDPADNEKLDEIDIEVFLYLTGKYPVEEGFQGFVEIDEIRQNLSCEPLPKYSRSRDALKPIRPDGFWFATSQYGRWWHSVATYANLPDDVFFTSSRTVTGQEPDKTEELAELHTIIQAIAYERGL